MMLHSTSLDTTNKTMEISDNTSDVMSETESDADDCDENELDETFSKTFTVKLAIQAISTVKTYLLHMDYIQDRLLVGLANNTIQLYHVYEDSLYRYCTFRGHSNTIVGVKFSEDGHTSYSASSDGTVKLWDMRAPDKFVNEFKDTSVTSPEQTKPLSCLDVSSNNRLLCAGTEQFEGDAYLLFWDIRNSKLLGGYWESHMDDITKVAFHPTDQNKLASCSTDGLINIYDLKESTEDDALTCSLNTESSVEQILWYKYDDEDAIACVTHPAEVQLWKPETGSPYAKFTREMLSKGIRRTSPEHCYVAGMHTGKSKNDLLLLTGSNWHFGECVRGLNVTGTKLAPGFTLKSNWQRIRASFYDSKTDTLFTGGERGSLSVWQALGTHHSVPNIHSKMAY